MRIHRSFNVLSPIVAFCSLYILYMSVGSNNTGNYLGSYVTNKQWLLYVYGLFFYICGIALANGYCKTRPQLSSSQNKAGFKSSSRRRNVLAVLGLGAFILSFAASGIPLFSSVDTARLLFNSPLGHLWPYAIRLLVAAAIVSIVLYYTKCDKGSKRWVHLLIGFTCVVFLTLLGSRSFLIPILVSGVVARSFLSKRFRISELLIGGLVLLIALSLFASYRASTEGPRAKDFHQEQYLKYGLSPHLQVLGSAYLYSLNGPHVLAKILDLVPEKIPYQYGGFFLKEAATILPGKQLLPDQWVAKHILNTTTIQMSGRRTHPGQGGGIPPTLLGGFYLDLGWIGVAFGMFAVGLIMQFLYRRASVRLTALDVAIYGCALSYFLISIYSMVTLKLSEVAQWMFVGYALWPTRGVTSQLFSEDPH